MPLTLKKSLQMGLIAEESEKTRRARKKLMERLKTVDKKMTPQALKQKREAVAKQLERHAIGRVQVQDLAQPSRSIQKIIEELTTQFKGKK